MLDDYSKAGYFTVFFIKVNEKYKIISDEEYTICNAVTKECSEIKSTIGEYGEHKFHTVYRSDMNNLEKLKFNILLSDSIISEIESLNNLDDLEQYKSHPEIFEISESTSNRNISMKFYFPVLIKQTKALPGYTTTDILYRGQARLGYKYDANNNFTSKTIAIDVINELLDYNNNTPIKMDSLLDLAPYSKKDMQHDKTCFNTDDSGTIIINDQSMCTESVSLEFVSSSYRYIPFFVSRKRKVLLEIDNTVNGVKRFDASIEKTLNYEITVKNTGEAPSDNNTIITYIPGEVVVEENSIKDNGVYNKDKQTITWTLGTLNINETKTFTYKGIAPEKFTEKELVGYSTVKSDDVKTVVASNNTLVVIDGKTLENGLITQNPDTGNHNLNIMISKPFLFIYSVLIVLVIALTIRFRRRIVKDKYIKEKI